MKIATSCEQNINFAKQSYRTRFGKALVTYNGKINKVEKETYFIKVTFLSMTHLIDDERVFFKIDESELGKENKLTGKIKINSGLLR